MDQQTDFRWQWCSYFASVAIMSPSLSFARSLTSPKSVAISFTRLLIDKDVHSCSFSCGFTSSQKQKILKNCSVLCSALSATYLGLHHRHRHHFQCSTFHTSSFPPSVCENLLSRSSKAEKVHLVKNSCQNVG